MGRPQGPRWSVSVPHQQALPGIAGHCRALPGTAGHCRQLHVHAVAGSSPGASQPAPLGTTWHVVHLSEVRAP